ncbi:MAG: hypothetical protein ACTSQ7_04895 [Alphaproteobacteria bacterium]
MSDGPVTVFEELSWHDDTLYGLRFDVGDSFQGDWRADLVLDIDHIVEWICGTDGGAQFRVAPATLVFHGATDLKIAIDWGDSGDRTALHEISIDGIAREPVPDQEGYPPRQHYRWRIALNWPQGGAISFGARGFTQTLRAEPLLLDQQRLPAGPRRT